MVLTDDNFATIVAAVEQGRVIYSNIRRTVYFLLSCNVGGVAIIFGAILIGWPAPLTAIQLLWLNLLTDGAPALALGLEKGEPDIMKRRPRAPKERIIDRAMAVGIGVITVLDALAILACFLPGAAALPGRFVAAQTIAFVTLCCSNSPRFTARSKYHSIFSIGVATNAG